jgi:hypothetical protein
VVPCAALTLLSQPCEWMLVDAIVDLGSTPGSVVAIEARAERAHRVAAVPAHGGIPGKGGGAGGSENVGQRPSWAVMTPPAFPEAGRSAVRWLALERHRGSQLVLGQCRGEWLPPKLMSGHIHTPQRFCFAIGLGPDQP